MLDKKKLGQLILEISTTQLRAEDIPDIDLYMDQVTTFIDNKLGGFRRHDKDKILTKSMINNYAKAGLLIPPKNKRYSKDNMILLIFIYKLKQLLSINDIGELFSPLFDGLDRDDKFLENMYNTLVDIEKDRFTKLEEYASNEIDFINSKDFAAGEEKLQWFLLVMLLVSRAEAERRMAEKIIDTYF